MTIVDEKPRGGSGSSCVLRGAFSPLSGSDSCHVPILREALLL